MLLHSCGFLIIFIIKLGYADKICDGKPDGTLLPNPDDCGKFYECNAGNSFELNCPADLHFNPEIGTCDKPENVQCEEKDEPEEDDMYCPPEDDPANLIFYPSKIKCEWYYLCSSGKPFKLSCAPGYHWNQKNFQCDIPENANCQIQQSSTTPEGSSTVSSSTSTPSSSTSSVEPETTRSTSSSTTKSSATTTESSTIETTTKSIETTSKSTTLSSTEPPTSQNPEVTTDINGVICPESGSHTFSHPQRCDFFFFCYYGISSLQKCAFYFRFDKIDHVCKPYNDARC